MGWSRPRIVASTAAQMLCGDADPSAITRTWIASARVERVHDASLPVIRMRADASHLRDAPGRRQNAIDGVLALGAKSSAAQCALTVQHAHVADHRLARLSQVRDNHLRAMRVENVKVHMRGGERPRDQRIGAHEGRRGRPGSGQARGGEGRSAAVVVAALAMAVVVLILVILLILIIIFVFARPEGVAVGEVLGQ